MKLRKWTVLIYRILQGRIEELDKDLELERGSRSKAEKSRQFLTRELTSRQRPGENDN